MKRAAILLLVTICTFTAVAEESVFDIRGALGRSFDEITLLPTRLTAYNQHDDAARATYTCCKPWQEEEIELALRANAAFLLAHPTSDFASNTLMHTARVNNVKGDFRAEITAYYQLLTYYPDSDMADDACWGLASMFLKDKDYPAAIDTLNTLIFTWPDSTWADDAHMAIARAFRELDDEEGYLEALEGLIHKHPRSPHCASAMRMLGDKYREVENYEAAIEVYEDLMTYYPYSCCFDQALFGIAESLRHLGDPQGALAAYRDLIEELPGSSLINRAMREANTLARNLRGQGQGAPPLYNTELENSGQAAQELFDYARHLQNYRRFSEAIDTYRQFIRQFPGSSNYDNAFFNIGVCYQQMNLLFNDINKAEGPEDLYRLQSRFQDAVGRLGATPGAEQLSAVRDAAGAFAHVVNHLEGSALRDDALYEIARTYEKSEMIEDMVYTYQQLMTYFRGSPHEMEALYEVLKFYSDAKNFEASAVMYPELSAAFPHLFPKGLLANKNEFVTLMRAYFAKVDHSWYEYHHHHIPYRTTAADLGPWAAYNLAALNMARGEFRQAERQLKPLLDMRTHDLCAPATFLMAQALQRRDQNSRARDLYARIEKNHPDSGLADDARLALATMGQEIPADAVQRVRESFEYAFGAVDVYSGEKIVVFAPYTVSVKMRQYNMPNIWEQSQRLLEGWTGGQTQDRIVIAIDPACRRIQGSEAILLPGCKIADPPQWSLGFDAIARQQIQLVAGTVLGDERHWIDGLSRFAAASLQYDLVTETRDAIGSASAVVLPQQDVINARERALRALHEYVRTGSNGDPSPEVVAGMLYALLDSQGFSKERLIDREPYRRFFASLGEEGPGSGKMRFAFALNRVFDGAAGDQLRQWGLPVSSRMGR